MPKALTESQVNNLIKQSNPKFELIKGTFRGTTKRVGVHCKQCGHNFNPTFNTCRNKSLVCPECDRQKRLRDVQKRLGELDDGYLIDNPNEFKDTNHKISIIHLKCGRTFECIPSSMLSKTPKGRKHGARCPYCGFNHKVGREEFLNRLKNTTWNLVGEYKDYSNGLSTFKCKKCGSIFKMSPREAIRHNVCNHCSRALTEEEYKKRLYDIWGKRITLVSHYQTESKKVVLHDNRCGHTFSKEANKAIRKNGNATGCPYCSSSHMENALIRYFDKNKIDYTYQVKFNDLKDKQSLSYDFYLPKWNTLIELDGEQHFGAFDYFGGKSKFDIQKKHDALKNAYAINNNYNLIRIPYTKQRNLSQTLKRSLSKLTPNQSKLVLAGSEYNVVSIQNLI